jgi:hypothetical protein
MKWLTRLVRPVGVPRHRGAVHARPAGGRGGADGQERAAGLGWLLFFPNMFLAGVYFPTEEMSPAMRQIGTFTPLGSALHAVRDSWMGLAPRPEYLGIMAAWTLVAGALAARWLVVTYFAGLVVFAWVLTVRSPWFAFFTWTGFLYAFEYLPAGTA